MTLANPTSETALIVGASKGLGAALGQNLQKRGLATIEVARTQRHNSDPARTTSLACDLNNSADTQTCVHRLREILPTVDHFFWVAGMLIKGDFAKQSIQEITTTLDVNLRNPMQIAHAAWQAMASCATPKTYTIVASTAGLAPRQDEAVYASTKFAQVGFAKCLGLENKNPNLKVALVIPGGMQTPFWDNHKNTQITEFLNPEKVAEKIISDVFSAPTSFIEISIPRGSLGS